MDWNQLKEKAKEMGYNDCGDYLETGNFTFRKSGSVVYKIYHLIALDRTPEQMLMIMRGLE